MTFRWMAVTAIALTLGVNSAAQTAKPTATAVEVFKTPTCGCCSKWVDHMKANGFGVKFVDLTQADLDKVKAKHGVPAAVHSCHTALVAGYVVEGHIPADVVKRLLKEKPKVTGIAVPGMPVGSPGMEVAGVKPQPYDVLTFDRQGKTRVFATVR